MFVCFFLFWGIFWSVQLTMINNRLQLADFCKFMFGTVDYVFIFFLAEGATEERKLCTLQCVPGFYFVHIYFSIWGLKLAVVTTYCFDLPSDKEESKINMLLPLKSLRNVYSSEYIKGLEIVCNMIINKAAEVWSKWGRVNTHTQSKHTHTYRYIHRRRKSEG